MRICRLVSPLLAVLLITGCSTPSPKDLQAEVLPIPSAAPPILDVHIADENTLCRMDAEDYLLGVVAGEMPSSWPLEALKAQAILARTFLLKFITEKESRYPGADISTDIAEAQAYDASAVNGRIRQAVQETRGQILLTGDGTLPYTWFHSHSGGMTETAVDGIDWQGEEPAYIRATPGRESADAPESVQQWTAIFSVADFTAACRSTGADVTTCTGIKIGKRGKSGRAVTLLVDGTAVNTARLRISLGSAKMRSTLLTSWSVKDGTVTLSGRGYGHGVGMSQWGANALARIGMSAEEIALHYYQNLKVVRVWE